MAQTIVDRLARQRIQGATLRERILDGLKVFGITKAELARRVGVPWRRIHASGENKPTTENLQALAGACGSELCDIRSG